VFLFLLFLLWFDVEKAFRAEGPILPPLPHAFRPPVAPASLAFRVQIYLQKLYILAACFAGVLRVFVFSGGFVQF
jgi:hypothetical protein